MEWSTACTLIRAMKPITRRNVRLLACCCLTSLEDSRCGRRHCTDRTTCATLRSKPSCTSHKVEPPPECKPTSSKSAREQGEPYL
ncbi:hypothetical protein HPP92_004221 [Vanilla planifolia]|uniref:Uncharacterized protein n=1 Tax=Vanilla planifolia TaxID=51239 RepID=A0A835RSA3_VANPL|nr:hypothetical protein HPP92_004666 [Vanilla planifolia]KAG0493227.1 hypothetical protein HPP92_004221 [Vanilla planifolia]